jgi:hypothetical protein
MSRIAPAAGRRRNPGRTPYGFVELNFDFHPVLGISRRAGSSQQRAVSFAWRRWLAIGRPD